jgi:hypothetical protein
MRITVAVLLVTSLLVPELTSAGDPLDERPAADGEWGYRPASQFVSKVNPPSFSWRPQQNISSWEVQCAHDEQFERISYQASDISLSVHCPSGPFSPGRYVWRYRGIGESGAATNWSQSRQFTVADDASEMPFPSREDLLARIPDRHPRLFVRPEDVPRLRKLARGRLSTNYQELVEQCERLLRNPPNTDEPPKYGPEIVPNSDPWREIWWGNRTYTTAALNGAATLAFTRLLDDNPQYGQAAKRILLECAKWDPVGATGYRYNDEAGMPYAYYFARTYSFIHDLLSEEERKLCRHVMKIRGDEMYQHLYPRHLWKPYSSHSNRAWHFLGEVGIAMLGEVKGADDWVWFAANVFQNVYPVWSDDDGGWHEGFGYWNSYVGRFTWWADITRSAMGINVYDKPYFSQIGYYPMYLLPPGKIGGGFGDLNARKTSSHAAALTSQLATQAGNGHWQWYVRQLNHPQQATGYMGFVRGALPSVDPTPPNDLPTSRLFRDTGQAVLNTSLEDARHNVQAVFKSSPFGTQSHGYEANNSFLLWAYGRRLLVRSGYRDSYGTEHHRKWMWSTRSVNNITVDGTGQLPHSKSSVGRIVAFETSPATDIVIGEAGQAYRDSDGGQSRLNQFTRAMVFIKPDLLIVFDQLVAHQDSSFQYWLHATEEFQIRDQHHIGLRVKDVGCDISILAPSGLTFKQTDQYDPNPRPRITLREWHLTASTPEPAKHAEFIAVFRPYRLKDQPPKKAELQRVDDGYVLTADTPNGSAVVLLPTTENASISAQGLTSSGDIIVQLRNPDGTISTTQTAKVTRQ